MTSQTSVGILLPDDGPDDYEWTVLNELIPALPLVKVRGVRSDGLHAEAALSSLGDVQRLLPHARALVDGGCSALVWACTSASFIGGLRWAEAQSESLSRLVDVPVSSTALAFRDALLDRDWRRVNLLSPYPRPVTCRLVDFFNECGITVRKVHSLNNLYASQSHTVDLITEARHFWSQCDELVPIVVPDTAVNTLGCWRTLTDAIPATVITANQVTLCKALNLLDWKGPWPECLTSLSACA